MAELDDEDAIDDADDVSATEAGGGRGSALPHFRQEVENDR